MRHAIDPKIIYELALDYHRPVRNYAGRAAALTGPLGNVFTISIEMVEAAPCGFILAGPDGRIALVNARVEADFGYLRQEVIGQPVEMLIPERSRTRHPVVRNSYFAHPGVRSMTARGINGRRKDGSEVPLEIGLIPVHTSAGPGVLAMIFNVSLREQHAGRMEEERAFMRQVIDISPNLIFAKNREGRFTLANRAVAEIDGTTVENLIGKSDADFNPNAAEVEHFRRLDMEVMDSLQERFIPEERLTDATGKTRWMQTVKLPILDKDGRANQVLGSATDITRRKELELELAEQRNELARLARMSMLGELSGSLAHELNQPLTAILSNAQAALRFLARDDVDLGEVRAILNDIVNDDKRAGEIIRGLRQMLRKGEVTLLPLDLNEVVFEVLRLVRSDLLNSSVNFTTELAAALPLVNGDRVQLQQVLLNLVLNGCEAMADIAGGERQLVIRTAPTEQQCVCVSVADRGHGIPPENLERVFEPFFSTKAQGLGLGLSVCRTIISAQGGLLWATHNTARGAIFHFTLPANSARPV